MPWFERSPSSPPKTRSRRALRRSLLLRKVLAAALVGCATWLSLQLFGIGMTGEGTVTVLVAARDLPAGHAVQPSDVTGSRVPATVVADPVQQVTRATLDEGRILTGEIRAGEMLSETRLRKPDTFDGLGPDRRAVHLPLRDNGTASLLHPGSRVDVYSTADGKLVVADVSVLHVDAGAAPGGTFSAASSNDPAGVVIAVPVASATAMMSALGAHGSDGGQIHLALRSP